MRIHPCALSPDECSHSKVRVRFAFAFATPPATQSLMLSRLAPRWRLAAGAIRVGTRAPHTHTICAFSTASDAGDSQWNDFNTVVKELRRIAREEGIEGALPDTKLLKELGHKDLVLAIRKKHGGFVSVASKIGFSVDKEHVEIQKKITSRANRRKKRGMRISKHEFY